MSDAQACAELSAAERRAVAMLDVEFDCTPDFAAAFLDAVAGALGVALEPPFRRGADPAPPGVDFTLLVGARPLRIALVCLLRIAPTLRDIDLADAAAAAILEAREADFAFTVLIGGDVDAARAATSRFAAALPLARIAALVSAGASARTGEIARRVAHAVRAIDAVRALAQRVDARLGASGVERFRTAYLDLIEDLAPGLPLPPATAAPSATASLAGAPPLDVLTFAPGALPRWPFMPPVMLAHHVRDGAASIRLVGWGGDLDGLAAVMEPSLRDTDYLLSATEGARGEAPDALIVALIPRLDPAHPLEPQYESAVACIRTLREMQLWFVSRRAAARYWAEFAAPNMSLAGSRVRRGLALG